MSKYNRVLAVLSGRRSPVTSTGPTGRTYEGAPGWARDAKSELFLLAITSLAGEDSFYEWGVTATRGCAAGRPGRGRRRRVADAAGRVGPRRSAPALGGRHDGGRGRGSSARRR